MRRILLASFVLILAALTSSAQTSSGSIAGTVVDSQQAAVVNATVTLIDPDRKTSTVAKTDSEGRFVFPQVQPGKYTLTVENAGL